MQFALTLGTSLESDQLRLTNLLAGREVQVIRERPASVQHAPFLKNVRTMAGSMRWIPSSPKLSHGRWVPTGFCRRRKLTGWRAQGVPGRDKEARLGERCFY